MRKKMKRVVCVLAALLLLCSCGRATSLPQTDVSKSETQMSAAADSFAGAYGLPKEGSSALSSDSFTLPVGETRSPSAPASGGASSAFVLRPGVYVNDSQESLACKEEYRPYIALYTDGSCVLYENYYWEAGAVEGSYTAQNDVLTLKLTGNTEYHSVSFRFASGAENALILQTDLESYGNKGVSQVGDRFVLSARSLPKKPSAVQRNLPYRDKLAQTLWSNYSVWIPSDDNGLTFYVQHVEFALMDLDGDGQVELIRTDLEGSGRYSYNSYYKIDPINNKITEIPTRNAQYGGLSTESDDEFGDQMDLLILGDSLKMYRTAQGKIVFWGSDTERAGGGCWSDTVGYLQYDGRSVGENYLFSEYFASAEAGWTEGDEDEHTFRKYTNKELYDTVLLSESQYEAEQQAVRSGWKDLHMRYAFVSLPGMNGDNEPFEMSDQQVMAKLLESYDAFSYDGYVKK